MVEDMGRVEFEEGLEYHTKKLYLYPEDLGKQS